MPSKEAKEARRCLQRSKHHKPPLAQQHLFYLTAESRADSLLLNKWCQDAIIELRVFGFMMKNDPVPQHKSRRGGSGDLFQEQCGLALPGDECGTASAQKQVGKRASGLARHQERRKRKKRERDTNPCD